MDFERIDANISDYQLELELNNSYSGLVPLPEEDV